MRRQLIFILVVVIFVSGCAVIGAIALVTSADCKVKINEKYISGSCDLINGVFFEKLTVLATNENNLPVEYIVTERFQCYNPGVNGKQTFWPDKLYFDKMNGHYKWAADTVDVHYKMEGRHREIISRNKAPENYNEKFILDSEKYETCPIEFELDTWYNVKISDNRVLDVYLFVDRKSHFHTYQFDSGVSPI